MSASRSSSKKLLILPVAAILFVALFPQAFFMLTINGSWQGSYFASNYDEPAYSAYVNALARGEPRKNDPFLGLADSAETPQPETLYSIQFIPAYSIAIPTRVLGLSVSTSFILLTLLIAFFSLVTIRWFLLDSTGDEVIASVGPLVILLFGTAVAYQGELRFLVEGRVLADFLPFLRRYQPGFAFPLFFIFCLFAVRSVRSDTPRSGVLWAAAAGCIFAVLVFSYFYLWTAAAAWFACFALFVALFDKDHFKGMLTSTGILAVFGLAALIPYFYLLGKRPPDLDNVQLLTLTRMPEFGSPSLILGLVVAAVAIYVLRKTEARRGLPLIVSLALTPVVLFNQQVVTGRSLQPVHYELFIANYLVLTAAVLLISKCGSTYFKEDRPDRFTKGMAYLGLAAFGWGLFESYGSTTRNLTPAAIRDASLPAIAAAAGDGIERPVVLATNFVTADIVPSIGSARPLWNPHTSSAGGIDLEENKRLFYMFLYFSGYGEGDLERALKEGSFEVTAAVFGSEQALPALTGKAASITGDQIRAEAAQYSRFSSEIEQTIALDPVLTHVIVPAEAEPDFANLDKWYTRGAGRDLGLFRLYRVHPHSAR